MSAATTWNDPDHCPFCNTELPNPGAGFIDHVNENPDCESEFDAWRTQIADDIRGGWSG